jgi:hypothetical protein
MLTCCVLQRCWQSEAAGKAHDAVTVRLHNTYCRDLPPTHLLRPSVLLAGCQGL